MQGVSAEAFINNWLAPANYPIVDIDVSYELVNGKFIGKVSAHQSRFLISKLFDPDLNPEPLP